MHPVFGLEQCTLSYVAKINFDTQKPKEGKNIRSVENFDFHPFIPVKILFSDPHLQMPYFPI